MEKTVAIVRHGANKNSGNSLNDRPKQILDGNPAKCLVK